MTLEEYFAQDIVKRMEHAKFVLTDDIKPFPEGGSDDPLVFLDGGAGINVSDVLHDAIIAIRRLRGELK